MSLLDALSHSLAMPDRNKAQQWSIEKADENLFSAWLAKKTMSKKVCERICTTAKAEMARCRA